MPAQAVCTAPGIHDFSVIKPNNRGVNFLQPFSAPFLTRERFGIFLASQTLIF
jgi:hypothetical protein